MDMVILSQADLDQAVAQLAQEMVDEGKPMLLEGVDLDAYDAQVFQSEVLEKVSDKQPGVETGSFTLSVTTRVTGVFYSSKDVATAAEGQLYQELQSGFEVTQVNKDGLQATVQSVDAGQGIATLSVYLDGTAMISTGADLLDKARLIGKSSADVISRLEASDAIDRVEVNLKPFWLSRVPKAKDHITITVLGSGSN